MREFFGDVRDFTKGFTPKAGVVRCDVGLIGPGTGKGTLHGAWRQGRPSPQEPQQSGPSPGKHEKLPQAEQPAESDTREEHFSMAEVSVALHSLQRFKAPAWYSPRSGLRRWRPSSQPSARHHQRGVTIRAYHRDWEEAIVTYLCATIITLDNCHADILERIVYPATFGHSCVLLHPLRPTDDPEVPMSVEH